MKPLFLFFLTALALPSLSHAQAVSVAAARASATGSAVTVRGIVTNGPEFGGSLRYVQDGTGGIAAYSSVLSDLLRGDSVEISGTVSPYNNLLEIAATSVVVISSNNPLPEPLHLSMSEAFQEAHEGQLVRIDSVQFASGGTFANATNYVVNGVNGSEQLRTGSNTNLSGTAIPTTLVDVIGIMGQYQTTYQLLPRDLNDILYYGAFPVVTSELSQSNVDTTSFTVEFTTLHAGNTVVRYGLTPTMDNELSDATLTASHALNLTGLTPATVYYVQGFSANGTDTSASAVRLMMTASFQPVVCDQTLWSHVYHDYRLQVHIPCITVTGTVDHLIYEADGDVHIRLHLDPEYNYMLNDLNASDQFGNLVCEPVCVSAVTQQSAEASCVGFVNSVYIPNVGEYVAVTGPFVTDLQHGWNEIHPVTSISLFSGTGSVGDTAVVNGMTVYPNPASSQTTFRFKRMPTAPLFIDVIDALGRSAARFQMLSSQTLEMNCAHWPSGVYFYNVSQQNKVLRSGKFVVEHGDLKED